MAAGKGFTLNHTDEQLGKLMNLAADGLKGFQKGPVGEIPESPKVLAARFKTLLNMPPTERRKAMKDGMALSGHTGPEDNCKFCQFISDHISKASK